MCITDIPAQKKWHFSLRLTSKEGLWRRLSWIIIQQIFTYFVKVDIVPHFQGPKEYYVMFLCALPEFGVDVQLWLGENAEENFDGPILLCCVFFLYPVCRISLTGEILQSESYQHQWGLRVVE